MSAVITTIQYPTEAVKKLVEHRTDLIVIGDLKTPRDWSYNHVQFESFFKPQDFAIMKFLPENHYSRKNIGYLIAMQRRSPFIYDTDDDNIPNENWRVREYNINCIGSFDRGVKGWFNVYKLFSNNHVWPRGFSLKNIDEREHSTYYTTYRKSSIQQGLSSGEADVDAIFRLLNKYEVIFNKTQSIYINPGSWCPFNSQSTWWFPKAYPLMYLPVTASFRMADIWRSFVAQRCLWEIGEGVTFHSPAEVYQNRNKHDLLKDFEDEIPGYLNNDKIVEVLQQTELKPGIENICDNMVICYKELHNAGIYPMHELRSLNAWLKDIKEIWKP